MPLSMTTLTSCSRSSRTPPSPPSAMRRPAARAEGAAAAKAATHATAKNRRRARPVPHDGRRSKYAAEACISMALLPPSWFPDDRAVQFKRRAAGEAAGPRFARRPACWKSATVALPRRAAPRLVIEPALAAEAAGERYWRRGRSMGEVLFYLLLALTIVTLVGHGIWVVIAAIFRGLSGSSPARSGTPSPLEDHFAARRTLERLGNRGLLEARTIEAVK